MALPRQHSGDMDALTQGLSTKSDKIRTLGRAGYKRQQIADYLDIRYQHVRNVLVEAERRGQAKIMGPLPQDWPTDLETKSAKPPEVPSDRPIVRTVKVKLGPDGQLCLPGHMVRALGWAADETIWVNLEEGGEIRLADAGAVVRRVQSYVREHMPNMGSVDDFLSWRREEAAREERELEGLSGGEPG